MVGLERVEIIQPGYAIEYDYVDPRALDLTLAVRSVPGFSWRVRLTNHGL